MNVVLGNWSGSSIRKKMKSYNLQQACDFCSESFSTLIFSKEEGACDCPVILALEINGIHEEDMRLSIWG